MAKGYKDLVVWQKAKELAIEVYTLTEQFPQNEIYGLTAQMRRCAISISSNIAEGSKRNSKKDFTHFLTIAFGSGAELESQIDIVKALPFGAHIDYSHVDSLLEEVMKMFSVMIRSSKD